MMKDIFANARAKVKVELSLNGFDGEKKNLVIYKIIINKHN